MNRYKSGENRNQINMIPLRSSRKIERECVFFPVVICF